MSKDNYVCLCPGMNSPYICKGCTAREEFEAMDDRIEEFCGNCDKLTKNVLGEDEKCEECMCLYQEEHVREAILTELREMENWPDTVDTVLFSLTEMLKEMGNWRPDTHDFPCIIESIAQKDKLDCHDKIKYSRTSLWWRRTAELMKESIQWQTTKTPGS